MSGIGIAKAATELAVSIGVGSLVGTVVKTTLEGQKVNFVKRVSVGVGGLVLGSYLSDLASKHATDALDEVVEQVSQVRTVIQDAKKGNL
jgi:hypothetical protein